MRLLARRVPLDRQVGRLIGIHLPQVNAEIVVAIHNAKPDRASKFA